MTDDIVTRLAESACVGCYECVCGMCALLSDAVDEIKQLREQNDHLRENVGMLLAEARAVHNG